VHAIKIIKGMNLQQETVQKEVIDLNELLADIEQIIREKEIIMRRPGYSLSPIITLIVPLNMELEQRVVINRSQFMRTLSNLLDNAIEATPSINSQAKKIAINLSYKKQLRDQALERITISINDNGAGIRRERLAQLGNLGATFGKRAGSGLGLFGAKRFAQQMGGELKIKSGASNGTTISISLPLLACDYSAILLDDDELIRLSWKMIASKRGERILATKNWLELKQLLVAFDPKITIYLDYNLKSDEINGGQVAEELTKIGFKNIYLTTGMPKNALPITPWVKQVLGKTPPQQLDQWPSNTI
jgi:anti-sigma regulatory factor (Ser/Thr protein kinase)